MKERKPGYRYETQSGAAVTVLSRDLYMVERPGRPPVLFHVKQRGVEAVEIRS